tara:strand:- start:378 stop:2285 length:1908 start_codon:yes stop_codon:yes gene_type:complete
MCGFFGVIDFKSEINQKDFIDIKRGTRAIKYRGPDDENVIRGKNYCFGFRRLSIIDINADCQPYTVGNDDILMMCNGEIYNYLALKKDLISKGYIFKTKTDVEVILHGYAEWGEKLWTKLNGIFSIVIYDRNINKLFLVRDHMGVKPLHVLTFNNKLYFASDYNSFRHISNYRHILNESSLLSYLSFRYVIGEKTFYKDIKDVLPGSCLVYGENFSTKNQYWDVPVSIDEDMGFDFYINKLDSLLDESVNMQLVSDVPLGAFISGGLDSSLLLSYITKRKANLNTYITGFSDHGYNEFEYADIVADYLGLSPKKLIMSQDEYTNSIIETIKYRGEPLSVPHESAFLKMTRFIQKDISVVMSGEGADELFGGYGRIFRSPHDFHMANIPLLGRLVNYSSEQGKSKRHSLPVDHFLSRYSWFTNDDKSEILNKEVFNDNYYDDYSLDYIDTIFNKTSHLGYSGSLYYILLKLHLPNLLNRLDRMTMASSVEGRVPFLDYRLVDFVSRIPEHYKLRWKDRISRIKAIFHSSEYISERYDIPKYILKKLANGKVHNEIIYRKKMGFPVPLNNWIDGPLGSYAYDMLSSSDAKTKNLFNSQLINQFVDRSKRDKQYDLFGKKVWMLLVVELWMREMDISI